MRLFGFHGFCWKCSIWTSTLWLTVNNERRADAWICKYFTGVPKRFSVLKPQPFTHSQSCSHLLLSAVDVGFVFFLSFLGIWQKLCVNVHSTPEDIILFFCWTQGQLIVIQLWMFTQSLDSVIDCELLFVLCCTQGSHCEMLELDYALSYRNVYCSAIRQQSAPRLTERGWCGLGCCICPKYTLFNAGDGHDFRGGSPSPEMDVGMFWVFCFVLFFSLDV